DIGAGEFPANTVSDITVTDEYNGHPSNLFRFTFSQGDVEIGGGILVVLEGEVFVIVMASREIVIDSRIGPAKIEITFEIVDAVIEEVFFTPLLIEVEE